MESTEKQLAIIEETANKSSSKERREARHMVYVQMKETEKLLKNEKLTLEDRNKHLQHLESLVKCYDLLDKRKVDWGKVLQEAAIAGLKLGVIVGGAFIVGHAKTKMLDEGFLDKPTEGILNSLNKIS